MRVIGTGLPRTGTNSLKLALERLLGAPCYHMFEMVPRRDRHGPRWLEIVSGREADPDFRPDWSFLSGFDAIVDWPGSTVWDLLVRDFPDAVVVHSVRDDADQWWRSLDRTVGALLRTALAGDDPASSAFHRALTTRSGWGGVDDADLMRRRYVEHDAAVRAAVDPARLVIHNPRDEWGPLCAALGVPVPDEPYPESNSSEDFAGNVERARAAIDIQASNDSTDPTG